MNNFLPKFSAAILIALIFYAAGNFNPTEAERPYEAPDRQTQVIPSADRPVQSLRDFNNALVDIAEATSPAVVTVSTERTVRQRVTSPFDMFDEFFGRPRQQPREREFSQRGQGSGVIVSDDGLILTNHHVIANADTITVRTIDNVNLGATLVGSDPETDIAVLRVHAENLPSIQMGDSDELRVGEWVLAIGSPLSQNLAHTVTQGIVSAKGRSGINLIAREDFIQTDAAINPGNSGGPLINLDGEVVGINTAIMSRSGGFQGIGFAVPINMARAVLESLVETGRVIRGFIGLMATDIDELDARAFGLEEARGIIITQIVDDGPAANAGIQQDDIIIQMDGQNIRDFNHFRNLIAQRAPGSNVRIRVNREGEILDFNVTLTEAPQPDQEEASPEELFDRYGFMVSDMSEGLAERYRLRSSLQGVIVTEISSNSRAAQRGLREGDLIASVNRTPVTDTAEFNSIMMNIESGNVILLEVIRQNQRLFVTFEN